ncbi:MAG: carboxy-S-adenosyl-L-methionine synthase CmoA [Helicobacteraceae bacterium]|jgi:tRNA (cmo5U34)-methyltransferase|nr:carboxy-S-adenosyl-L-methionine synthase CmoA [Helicobacteraceae bacterium]
MRDQYFQNPPEKQFEFDAALAVVFDDMLARSVPQYNESLDTAADVIFRFLGGSGDERKRILDIGCSTATLLLKLFKKNPNFELIGADSSSAMIEKAREKASAFGAKIDFICADANDLEFNNLDAIAANYLLQFIRPLGREKFVEKICGFLKKGGIFVFSEKLSCDHKKLDKILLDRYYDFKRSMGYSDYEISAKREALENVLVPFSESENKKMVLNAGFSFVECVLRWNNFATFAAIKND